MIDIEAMIEAVRKKKHEKLLAMHGLPFPIEQIVVEPSDYLPEAITAIAAQLNRIEMKLDGICPGCRIRPKPPVICDADRSFPEWSEKQRALGFDPANGHKLGCPEVA